MIGWTRRHLLAAGGALGATAMVGMSPARAAGSINIGMEAGSPYLTFFSGLTARFTKDTGIGVNIVGVPHESMHQQFLLDAISQTGGFDVYEADQPWIPEFAEKGFIASLDDRISQADRQDFVGSTLDTVSYKGKLYALPFIVHNIVLYYRPDLFKKAGLSEPPKTWAEYRTYAKKLTDKNAGIWGTLIEGKQNGEAAIHLEAFMQQAGTDVIDANGKPGFDTKAAADALKLMTDISFEDQSSPPGLLDLSDMQGMFLDGKIAMAPVWPYLYALARDPKQSKVAGNVEVAPSPGDPNQVAPIFAWGFCVSSASKAQDAAWEWVKWSTSSDILAEFGKNQASPVPRKSSLEKVKADPALTDADKKAITTFSQSVAGSKSMPMDPHYPQLQDLLGITASSVMSKSQSIEDALKAAQAKAEEIMQS